MQSPDERVESRKPVNQLSFSELFKEGRKFSIQGYVFYIRRVTKKDVIIRLLTKSKIELDRKRWAITEEKKGQTVAGERLTDVAGDSGAESGEISAPGVPTANGDGSGRGRGQVGRPKTRSEAESGPKRKKSK